MWVYSEFASLAYPIKARVKIIKICMNIIKNAIHET